MCEGENWGRWRFWWHLPLFDAQSPQQLHSFILLILIDYWSTKMAELVAAAESRHNFFLTPNLPPSSPQPPPIAAIFILSPPWLHPLKLLRRFRFTYILISFILFLFLFILLVDLIIIFLHPPYESFVSHWKFRCSV